MLKLYLLLVTMKRRIKNRLCYKAAVIAAYLHNVAMSSPNRTLKVCKVNKKKVKKDSIEHTQHVHTQQHILKFA